MTEKTFAFYYSPVNEKLKKKVIFEEGNFIITYDRESKHPVLCRIISNQEALILYDFDKKRNFERGHLFEIDKECTIKVQREKFDYPDEIILFYSVSGLFFEDWDLYYTNKFIESRKITFQESMNSFVENNSPKCSRCYRMKAHFKEYNLIIPLLVPKMCPIFVVSRGKWVYVQPVSHYFLISHPLGFLQNNSWAEINCNNIDFFENTVRYPEENIIEIACCEAEIYANQNVLSSYGDGCSLMIKSFEEDLKEIYNTKLSRSSVKLRIENLLVNKYGIKNCIAKKMAIQISKK